MNSKVFVSLPNVTTTAYSSLKHFLRARNYSSKRWLDRHMNDPYVRESVKQNYRSRAAFKLIEIQKKYGIMKKGDVVVDAGAAPGGWSQIAAQYVNSSTSPSTVAGIPIASDITDFGGSSNSTAEKTALRTEKKKGRKGLLISIDLLPMSPVDNTIFMQGDFSSPDVQSKLLDQLRFRLNIPSTTVGLPTKPKELRLIDAIISDMAPSFSGNPTIDHLKTNDLCLSVFYFAQTILKL